MLIAQTSPTAWIVIGVVSIACLVALVLFAKYFPLWLQARVSGLDLPLGRLLKISRSGHARRIVTAAVRAKKQGIDVTLDQLEAHEAAGGNSMAVVTAMISAREKGLHIPWETITAIDLADRDVLRAVEQGSNPLTGRRFDRL